MREYDLLVFLLPQPQQAFSREELLKHVWGWEFAKHSTVTAHVRRLREKVELDPRNPIPVVTVFGAGYRYELEDDLGTVRRHHTGPRREADRLAGMVEDLFELSRINASALRRWPAVRRRPSAVRRRPPPATTATPVSGWPTRAVSLRRTTARSASATTARAAACWSACRPRV